MIREIENLTDDFGKLQQIADITTSLRFVVCMTSTVAAFWYVMYVLSQM